MIMIIPVYSLGLFEAMSAIEMMDAKMDAGMMCNQIKRKVLSLEHAVQVVIDMNFFVTIFVLI